MKPGDLVSSAWGYVPQKRVGVILCELSTDTNRSSSTKDGRTFKVLFPDGQFSVQEGALRLVDGDW